MNTHSMSNVDKIEEASTRMRLLDMGFGLRHVSVRAERVGEWGAAFSESLQAARELSFVVLAGPRGTGKTQMAVEIVRELKAEYGHYISCPGFGVWLRDGIDGQHNEIAKFRKLATTQTLILDDLQELRPPCRGSQYEESALTYALNERYANCRTTILITNLTIEAFKKAVTPLIASRIEEDGVYISCNWKSFRKKMLLCNS